MKITVNVKTNKVGSMCSTSFHMQDEDWDGMSDKEKAEVCEDALQGMYEWWYETEES